jgi:hypothetical protein
MQPLDLYQAVVDKDQRRLTSRLKSSIKTKVRNDLSTRTKAQSALLKENSTGHVNGNNIYVPTITEAWFLVRVHPEPCLILSRAQIRALLCSSKSKFILA